MEILGRSTLRRSTAVVVLAAFFATACYKTHKYSAPIDSTTVQAAQERGQIRVVKTDGRQIDLAYLDSWTVEHDTLLGYTQPPDEGARADWVIPLSEIERLEVKTQEMSTAEGVVLGAAAVGVGLLLLLIALGSSTT